MRTLLVALLLALCLPLKASNFDYGLEPIEVAPGVYMFEGRTEHFTRENGGNIVNTGFIRTDAGAVVIDTGPSRHYGEQMRAAIERITGGPVARVYITHAHPDHFLGNQAFEQDRIAALPATTAVIANAGEDLSANLYRLVGGWMEGTEVVKPGASVDPSRVEIGGRSLRLLSMSGHTDGDLAILDEQTGTLFAGDLVFFDRAATTPSADLETWLATLDQLEALGVQRIVPGHGPLVDAHLGIAQTRAYLVWLNGALSDAASSGMDMNEAMQIPIPERFRNLDVVIEEFTRTVVHLYPAFEQQAFDTASQ